MHKPLSMYPLGHPEMFLLILLFIVDKKKIKAFRQVSYHSVPSTLYFCYTRYKVFHSFLTTSSHHEFKVFSTTAYLHIYVLFPFIHFSFKLTKEIILTMTMTSYKHVEMYMFI